MAKKKRNVIIAFSIILFIALVANILFGALYEGIFTIDDVTVVKLNKPYFMYQRNSNFDSANSTSKEYAMHLAKCASTHEVLNQSKFDNLMGMIPLVGWNVAIKNFETEQDLLKNNKKLLVDVFGNRYYILVIYKESKDWYYDVEVSLIVDKVTGKLIKGYYGEWA